MVASTIPSIYPFLHDFYPQRGPHHSLAGDANQIQSGEVAPLDGGKGFVSISGSSAADECALTLGKKICHRSKV
jgi:hypothetical protein